MIARTTKQPGRNELRARSRVPLVYRLIVTGEDDHLEDLEPLLNKDGPPHIAYKSLFLQKLINHHIMFVADISRYLNPMKL